MKNKQEINRGQLRLNFIVRRLLEDLKLSRYQHKETTVARDTIAGAISAKKIIVK